MSFVLSILFPGFLSFQFILLSAVFLQFLSFLLVLFLLRKLSVNVVRLPCLLLTCFVYGLQPTLKTQGREDEVASRAA